MSLRHKLNNPLRWPIKKILGQEPIAHEIIREHLALERTKLANERTLLSYIRTSLYLLIGGIALLQLEDHQNLHWLGYASLIISSSLIGLGLYRFFSLKIRLFRLYREERKIEKRLKKTALEVFVEQIKKK